MSVGFRKSLFGFNSDDVMNYIQKTHKEFSQKETELNEIADQLKSELNSIKQELEELKIQKEMTERELKEYTDKQEEIERLSQNIGKLYLVAQTNAKAIMKNSEENLENARKEVDGNLSKIDEAHRSLEELKEKILRTSTDFAVQVDGLISSLSSTRLQIEDNINNSNEKSEEFNSVYVQLTK
ncbi:MAG: hypothetical protein MJ076_04865 [Clostridia bacterium]|nr:hypothetical protein [Clostridia bacterium]